MTVQGRPSRARYGVIAYAVTLAILSYIDRVAISQAATPIAADLHLSKSQMGLIFGAFALSYAVFEIPSGWMGDWMGARRVLVRIVLWWSAFTAVTGLAWSFVSLWVIRFLFGVGEAGCFPNLTKALSVWLPVEEHARAQGILWTLARWGGAFTPPLVVLAFRYMSWRTAFALFGALGLVWCVFFYRWYRDRPQEHPSVNAAELELLKHVSARAGSHGDVPWRRLLSNRSLWLLWAQYFCYVFTWYFYITWLPTYLQEFRGQTPAAAAALSIFPLFFGGFGSLASGLTAGRLARALGGVARARRITAASGLLGNALLLLAMTRIGDPLRAMMVMGLASFCADFLITCAWSTCMDIGGKYAGTVSGSMNMMGNLAGFVAPVTGGFLLERSGGNWNLLLYLMMAIGVVGALCWPFIDPVTPIDETSPTASAEARPVAVRED